MPRSAEEEARRAFVVEMFETVIMQMNSAAVDRYISPDYIQHSSLAEPGVQALKRWLDGIKLSSPDASWTIHRSFVDGDHVVIHNNVRPTPGEPGFAVVESSGSRMASSSSIGMCCSRGLTEGTAHHRQAGETRHRQAT